MADGGHLQGGRRGHGVSFVGIISHAQPLLEQGGHPIDGTPAASRLDVQVAVVAVEHESLITSLGSRLADNDCAARRFSLYDGQGGPGGFLNEEVEKFCGLTIGRIVVGQHDSSLGLAAFHQRELRMCHSTQSNGHGQNKDSKYTDHTNRFLS